MVFIGARVMIVGLRNTPHLNGTTGTVVQQDGDRFLVQLDTEPRVLKVPGGNLEVVSGGPQGPVATRRRDGEDLGENPIADLGSLMLSGALHTAKRHWYFSLTWVVGLLLAFFATGYAVSHDDAARFEALMQDVDTERLTAAELAAQRTHQRYYNSKGWFSCDETCQKYKRTHEAAVAELEVARGEMDAQISAAKRTVGLFSTYGVSEARELFWRRFAQGKQFAKNQSFWDLIFGGMMSMGRDEGLASFLLRFVIHVLFNFTLGIIGAAVGFMWTLWSVIQTFQPGLLTGSLFFLLASIAACSFLVSWLIGLYTIAAGGAVVIGHATMRARIEAGNPRAPPRRYVD